MTTELGHLARAAAAILCLLIFQVAPSVCRAQARISGGAGTCIGKERDALLTFKAGLLDPAGRLSSWQGKECCRWEGVRCSNRTGHVIKLILRNTYSFEPTTSIYGSYMAAYDEVDNSKSLSLSRDEMSSSLAALQQLRYLDLSSNDFNDTSIPEFLGSLENLRYLNLSSSGFSGRIPSQLGNLSKLQYLDVSGNYRYHHDVSGNLSPYLDGGGSLSQLHAVDLAWLSRLSLLSNLDMREVDLSPM